MVRAALLVLACLPALAADGPAVLDVRATGAKGDGRSKDTQAIQAAIDRAAAAGGTVVFSPGRYLSGTLELRSNVTLRIEMGAALAFSPDDNDFAAYEDLPDRPRTAENRRPPGPLATPAEMRRFQAPPSWDDEETSYGRYALLWGNRVRHVAIEGQGEIDGNRTRRGGPKPIAFRDSEWITIRGITVRNAPNYNISLIATDHVEIEGVRILGGFADGIDPDNCHFVRITDCEIDTADDAICPKASLAAGRPARGTKGLVVANCLTRTSANHFKFGTESEGGLSGVAVTNCVMLGRENGRPARTGISIESVDGGKVEGVTIDNVMMEDVLAPVFLRLGARGRGMERAAAGSLDGVTIRNVTARGAAMASSITGIAGAPVREVTIDGLEEWMEGGGAARGLDVPELADRYPSGDMFGELPALGVYGRHVEGLALRNVRIHAARPDERPAVVVDDAAGLDISGLDAGNAPAHGPVVLFREVAGALVYGTRLARAAEVFLEVRGAGSRAIALRGNDLRLAQKEARVSEGAPAGAVSTDRGR